MTLSLHTESRVAKRVKILGVLGWAVTVMLAGFIGRGDLLGAAGAVGLAALVPYVFIERRKIADERASFVAHFGESYHEITWMTNSEYEQLSSEEQHAFNETGADIGSIKLAYEDDVKRIETLEVWIAVSLTLQWAFGTAVFDLIRWTMSRLEM